MKKLKVLIVEDSEDDALMLLRHLKRNDYEVDYQRVQDAEAMRKAIGENDWEIVLSDYSMPGFDGLIAISILKEMQIDIPFIMISGTIGEETAVKAMIAGADDYFIKGSLSRLIPAIERTLKEAENRRARRKAEDDLKENKKRLQLALNAVQMGVWEWNLQNDEVYWSPECFEIIDAESFDGKLNNFLDLVHPEDALRVMNALTKAIETNTIYRSEFRVIKNDGEIIWVANYGLTEYDAEGKPLRIIGTVQNITESKNAELNLQKSEEKLRQAQKLESVGRLAGGIAHDFNNMLTVIKGYSDLSLRMLPRENPVRCYVEEIKKAGERSSSLTYQLLAFSRTQILQPEVLNINQIIAETIKMLKYMIGEDIRIILQLDAEIAYIKADHGQISQVLMNLLVNARDAMPEGGEITIKTEIVSREETDFSQNSPQKAEKFVKLKVQDTGTGMDSTTLKNVFEPFYTTKEIGKGTGLGLSTVYGIIEQSGGQITVKSELGIGTAFEIYLPQVSKEENFEIENESIRDLPQGRETILIVEDEELVRNLTRDALLSNGYQVIEAQNGAEAVKLFEKNSAKIDLLMTDVVMPEMSGYELFRKLSNTSAELPKFLFTSGYLEDERVKNTGFDISRNFIQKPFQLNELILKIQEILTANQNNQ